MATKRKTAATVPARYTRPTRAVYKLPPAPPPCCNELDTRFGEHDMVPWGSDPRFAICSYRCGYITGPTVRRAPARKKAEKPAGADLWAPLLGERPTQPA